MVKQLYFKEVDFGINAFTMTKSRAEVVDFTVPFHEEPSTFLIKRPTEYKLASYLNPFQVSTEVIHI